MESCILKQENAIIYYKKWEKNFLNQTGNQYEPRV